MLAAHPNLAEAVGGAGPLPFLTLGLSRLTGLVPFSLAEIVVLGVVVRQGVGAWGGMRQVRRGEDRPGRTLGRGGLRLLQDVGVIAFLFYLLWGTQYARPGLHERLGLPAQGAVSTGELRALAEASVHAGNGLYLAIHGSDDAGEPTPPPRHGEAAASLVPAWEAAAVRWSLDRRTLHRHGAPKPFLFTPLVKRFGIAGMYFPFTGEALVLGDLPGPLLGKELGHEMAHQRGIAREADANALALLVAREAADPTVRYAGAIFLQRQAVQALARVDPEGAREVMEARSPGVRRDLDALVEYWMESRGPLSSATTRMNHAMLRTHGITEGVESYRGSLWIFLALTRREGAEAIVPPVEGITGPTQPSSGDPTP